MNNNGKKFSLFHFKGLPIAILALGIMAVFIYVSYYATQQSQTTASKASERKRNEAAQMVQQNDNGRNTSKLDSLINDSDSLLKTDSDPTDADLSDLQQ